MIKKIKKKIILLHKSIYLFNIGFFLIVLLIMYVSINYHMSKMAINNIKAIGESEYRKIESLLDGFKYEVLSCSRDNDIISMDKEKIDKKVSFIKYYKKFYKDIIIINNNNEVLTGYLDSVKDYLYKDCILEALKGKIGVSKPISIEDDWYIDIVSPIKNTKKILGVIAIRISLTEVSQYLKSYNYQQDMDMYLVDEKGYFLTKGQDNKRKIGVESININDIKHSIDFNPNKIYKNYDNNDVYGKYYDLSYGNWTLIVEVVKNKSTMKLILLIVSFITLFIIFLMNKIIGNAYKYECEDPHFYRLLE